MKIDFICMTICVVLGLIALALINAFVPPGFQISIAYLTAYIICATQCRGSDIWKQEKQYREKIRKTAKESWS